MDSMVGERFPDSCSQSECPRQYGEALPAWDRRAAAREQLTLDLLPPPPMGCRQHEGRGRLLVDVAVTCSAQQRAVLSWALLQAGRRGRRQKAASAGMEVPPLEEVCKRGEQGGAGWALQHRHEHPLPFCRRIWPLQLFPALCCAAAAVCTTAGAAAATPPAAGGGWELSAEGRAAMQVELRRMASEAGQKLRSWGRLCTTQPDFCIQQGRLSLTVNFFVLDSGSIQREVASAGRSTQ